ncbi:hypothetical protein [Actinoalloteichus sp. GBA129-24]|uniref:hypothetical protein n=1 Tax=Actinoalloteichus sp. GBA129-24 TaxID=1612551 RepID=UPI0012F784F4|nr:hypothetical protein [Actinoalloteichus sp. GBA129-24]
MGPPRAVDACRCRLHLSLLIGELVFAAGCARAEHVEVGVLAGSPLSAFLATLVLVARNRVYRRIAEAQERGADVAGVGDGHRRRD